MKTRSALRIAGLLVLVSLGSRSVSAVAKTSARGGQSTTSESESFSDDFLPRRNSFSFGVSVFKFNYKEELEDPKKSAERGILPAVTLGFESNHPEKNWYFSSALSIVSSHTTYDGSKPNPDESISPLTSRTEDTIVDLEGDIGTVLATLSSSDFLKGYSGLGVHFWDRDLSDYDEKYTWLVLPLGMVFEHQFGDRVQIALDLSARLSFLGTMAASNIDADPFVLGAELGYRAQIPFRAQVSRTVALNFTPWAEYSAIGQSNSLYGVDSKQRRFQIYEPSSRTYQYGGSTAVSILF